MASRLGLDTDEDFALLERALTVTATYRPMLEDLRWPAPAGSELARLDAVIKSNISPTDTFVASQRTAVAAVLHLAELFGQDLEPRASVAITLSRAALVSAAHIV